jgi:hypothetical protein
MVHLLHPPPVGQSDGCVGVAAGGADTLAADSPQQNPFKVGLLIRIFPLQKACFFCFDM